MSVWYRIKVFLKQFFCRHYWTEVGLRSAFGFPYREQRCIRCHAKRTDTHFEEVESAKC